MEKMMATAAYQRIIGGLLAKALSFRLARIYPLPTIARAAA